jgi:hypothetical protein
MTTIQIPIRVSRKGIKALVKMFYPTMTEVDLDKMKTTELYDMYMKALEK